MKRTTDFALLVGRFLTEYLVSLRNVSENTILSYRDTIVLLITFMSLKYEIKQENIKLNDISETVIEEFLKWLEIDRKCAISTRNQRLAVLHSLFRYIGTQQPEYLFQVQKILSIPDKKVAQKLIKYLDIQEVKSLLSLPDASTKRGRRDQGILCLMYDSGCRVQELADIKVEDIRFTIPPQVKLHGKGKKMRTVPLMKETAAIIKDYVHRNKLDNLDMSDTPLFYNSRGEKFTRQGITYILKKYAKLIGLSNITPHILRHTKAMHLTDAEVNPIFIRDFLGHADLKTTQIYSRTSIELKRKVINKLNEQYSASPKLDNQKDWTESKDLLDWLSSL